jgi:3-hydroxyisobutyrate dehydrogenase-like beta-hydroxyacid dehydrogenase
MAASIDIGFVGLGQMGGNMAARLLDAGYRVHGTCRTRERATELIERGLRWCATPRQVAAEAEVLFTSLPDDTVLEGVASGSDGIIGGLAAGDIWVDVSTVSPRLCRDLAARVHAQGAAKLDAPVSGSVPQVQSGTLTIIVGGDRDAYERVEPLLRELGTPHRVGEDGQGMVLKLAINISLAVQMLALSEGLLLAERAGMDTGLALEVMTESAIGSPMLKARAPLVLDLPDDAWFDIDFMQKDIELALDTATELKVPLRTAESAREILAVARELGYGQRDLAALFTVLEQSSPARPDSP